MKNATHLQIDADGSTGRSEPSTPLRLVRLLTVAAYVVTALLYMLFSLRWRISVDTPVMHYVVFLMHHGLRPYSQITDNNMPGAYLSEAAAMGLFGRSDLAWRVYEFFLMGVFTVSAVSIARRWDWAAGVFAAGFFIALHAAEGPQLAVERELVIGVLLMVACALLIEGVERRFPALLALFGLACGACASIKPTYLPLPVGLLLLAAWHLRRERVSPWPYLGYSLAGLVAAGLIVAGFLSHFHAWSGFLFILTKVIPAYGGISRMSLPDLLRALLPRVVLVILALTVPLAFLNADRSKRWNWQRYALLLSAGFGLLSYIAQGKGYVYHRYIFLMFVLLLAGLEIFDAVAAGGWLRWFAVIPVGLALVVAVPSHLHSAETLVGRSAFELTLERDLDQLGGRPALQEQVECFDLVYGCLDALYHLGIVENSGTTGDMLYFPARISPPALFYRSRFWQYAREAPSSVLVVSNGVFAETNNYGKVNRWPEFASYLADEYQLVVERHFPHERYSYYARDPFPPTDADSYRVYIRRGSPLLSAASRLQQGAVEVAPCNFTCHLAELRK